MFSSIIFACCGGGEAFSAFFCFDIGISTGIYSQPLWLYLKPYINAMLYISIIIASLIFIDKIRVMRLVSVYNPFETSSNFHFGRGFFDEKVLITILPHSLSLMLGQWSMPNAGFTEHYLEMKLNCANNPFAHIIVTFI